MEMKDRILKVIQTRNVKKTEFAKAIGVSPPSVTQMCSGKINPSSQTIKLISREFGISEEWLLTGEGDMENENPHREKLENFFSGVLSTAPDDRSAFIAALDDLPADFWPMIAELARNYADKLK